jgi:two-component system, cell cycle sensor histidine kinase and response regulator CckA
MSEGKKILIVDDEEIVGETLIKMLKHLKYDVNYIMSSSQAITEVENAIKDSSGYDAVIMDITIPDDMDADEAGKQILKIDPNIKIIISSGYSSHPIIDSIDELGFSGFIPKPFNIEELNEMIQSVTGQE